MKLHAKQRRTAVALLTLALGSIFANTARSGSPASPQPKAPPARTAEAIEPAVDNHRIYDGLVRQVGLHEDLETIGAAAVDFDANQLRSLCRNKTRAELRNIPVGPGLTEDFSIEPFDVFTADGRVIAVHADGTETRQAPQATLFRGMGIKDPTARMLLSVAPNGNAWMRVESDSGKFIVGPADPTDATSDHLMSDVTSAPIFPAGTFCSSQTPFDFQEIEQQIDGAVTPVARLNGQMHEAVLMVDINYALVMQSFAGDINAAQNYIAFIVGEASQLYETEIGVRLRIGTLFYWDAPDPFTAYDSEGQLVAYRDYCNDYRTDTPRHVAVLMAERGDFGGIAYVGRVCDSSSAYAVTNLNLDGQSVSQGYSWDVVVVAHELGHSFGSPHTHGYQPPIDCCMTGETCSYQQPQVGTIMSYCHIGGYGIQMTFHEAVRNQIHGYLSQVACLDVASGGGGNGGGGGGGLSDDPYEPNDTDSQAFQMEPGQFDLVGLNPDWFWFEVTETSRVTVNINGSQGDLDLYLASETDWLANSELNASNESVSADVSPGYYFILVQPYNNQGSEYTLALSLQGLGSNGGGGNGGGGGNNGLADDAYEENDVWQDAPQLTTGEYQLVGLDTDWFIVEVSAPSRLQVGIVGPEGDLDLYLASYQGWLGVSESPTSSESVEANVQPGTYFIAVHPWEGNTSSYTMRLALTAGLSSAETKPINPGVIRGEFSTPVDPGGSNSSGGSGQNGGGETTTIDEGGSGGGTTVTTGDAACGTGMATATPIGVIGLMVMGLCRPGRTRPVAPRRR